MPQMVVTSGMSTLLVTGSSNVTFLADSTATQVWFKVATNPIDGHVIAIKDWKGQSQNANNRILLLGYAGGPSIEDPNNLGNYGVTGLLNVQGGAPVWQYNLKQNQYILWTRI
jgi:hypothetical protein